MATRRTLVAATASIGLLWASVLAAAPVPAVVTGVVVKADGTPIPYAEIELHDGATKLTLAPWPVDLQGRFSIKLSSFTGTHLECRVTARGFVPTAIVIPVANGSALGGQIALSPAPGLKAESLNIASSERGESVYIDLLVSNSANSDVYVKSVKVRGQARSTTSCLDLRPALIFRIKKPIKYGLIDMRGSKTVPVVIEEHADHFDWREEVEAAGQFEELPCQQARLQLDVPALFGVERKAVKKLRLVVPRQAPASEGRESDLMKWEQFAVALDLNDGTSFEVNNRR